MDVVTQQIFFLFTCLKFHAKIETIRLCVLFPGSKVGIVLTGKHKNKLKQEKKRDYFASLADIPLRNNVSRVGGNTPMLSSLAYRLLYHEPLICIFRA